MKRIYYFGAGVALGVAATRRTRRAKEAAREALKAKVTPSAIAADVADAIAELGNAVGYFAADVRQGVLNRRASYRPMIDNATGAVVLVGPEGAGPVSSTAPMSTAPMSTAPMSTAPMSTAPMSTPPVQNDARGRNDARRARAGGEPADLPHRRAPGAPPPPRRPARRSA